MATTIATCGQCCLTLQKSLESKVPQQLNPTFRPISDDGAQAALRAPGNRGVFDAREAKSSFGGKKMPDTAGSLLYEVKFVQEVCSDPASGYIDICTGGTTVDNSVCLDVKVENYYNVEGTVTVDDFNAICNEAPVGVPGYGTPLGRLNYDVRSGARRIIKKQNEDLIDAMIANGGAFVDGTTFAVGKPLNLTNAAGGINLSEWTLIKDELRQQRLDADGFIALGGSTLANFKDRYALQDGCCNDEGQRVGGLEPIFYDSYVDTSFAANNNMIVWTPGAYQLIDWTINNSYRSYSVANEIATTIMIDGIEFDYFLKFDCGAWKWGLGKGGDLFVLPQTAYDAGCNAGKGSLHYTLACGAPTC